MSDYRIETDTKYAEKTVELLTQLPEFCSDFYAAKQLKLQSRSQWNYANRMKVFLEYLHFNVDGFKDVDVKDYDYSHLKLVTPKIVDDFVTYLSLRSPNKSSVRKISKNTINNYMACLSTYYSQFMKRNILTFNPFASADKKNDQKQLVYLDATDQSKLVQSVTYGQGLTPRQQQFHDKTALRDICMVELLLDTGIRISELVGVNLDDIDWRNHKIFIIRKGNKEDTVYFSDRMENILKDYIETRDIYEPDEAERALFLASVGAYKGSRITPRTVERIVKKHARAAALTQAEKITPHKLRSSFAMDSLSYSGNIALVQQQLGHKNINTTTRYAKAQETDKELNRNFRQK